MQAGDAVILNAANSCIGQLLVQLCAVLRLRCIALVRDHGRFAQTQAWLQGLGATAVFQDETFSKVGALFTEHDAFTDMRWHVAMVTRTSSSGRHQHEAWQQ